MFSWNLGLIFLRSFSSWRLTILLSLIFWIPSPANRDENSCKGRKKNHFAWLKSCRFFMISVSFSILCVRSELHFLFEYICFIFPSRWTVERFADFFFLGILSSWIYVVSCVQNAFALLSKLHSSGKKWCCKFAFLLSSLLRAVITFIDSWDSCGG